MSHIEDVLGYEVSGQRLALSCFGVTCRQPYDSLRSRLRPYDHKESRFSPGCVMVPVAIPLDLALLWAARTVNDCLTCIALRMRYTCIYKRGYVYARKSAYFSGELGFLRKMSIETGNQ